MTNFENNRVLALLNILLQYSDELHQLSMKEILDKMALQGHVCSEDSIGRYIKQLRNELGIDVISCRGRNAKYFIGERLLEKEELKLIIDAINASNFVEKSIAEKMIHKLKSLVSVFESQELTRNVLGVSIAKAENKRILYNINEIQRAIDNDKQISFEYMKWDRRKKLVRKSSIDHTISPWALIWANDRYYLFGYNTKGKNDIYYEKHYRVDKMNKIEMIDGTRTGKKQFKGFNASTYVSRRIGMFSGKEENITVRISENLIGAFIDQFGKRIEIKEEQNGMFLVNFTAVPSNNLYGWLLGMESVEIISPQSIRKKMIELIEINKKMYTN